MLLKSLVSSAQTLLSRGSSRSLLLTHLTSSSSSTRRLISSSSSVRHYEGDGKTTVTILNNESDSPLMVDAYHENGFRLNNGFAVFGPMALFPKTVLAWDVPADCTKITPESLIMYALLEPKLDILVIGIGDVGGQLPKETLQYLRKKRINFEILSTDHACTTFNFLNAERRCVAAALIPPKKIRILEEDLIRSQINMRKLMDDKLPKDVKSRDVD